METTDHGYGDEFALAGQSREGRRLAAEALMGPRRMVILCQVLPEQPLQMPLV